MNVLLTNIVQQIGDFWSRTNDPRSGTWEVHLAIIEIARQRPSEFTLADYWEGVSLASFTVYNYNLATLEEALEMELQTIRAVVAALNP